VRLLNVWENVPHCCEVNFVQLTHIVWTQINDNGWIYYAPGTDSMTVSCADRHPVDIPLKWPVNCFLTQPARVTARPDYQSMRSVLANSSNHKQNQLIQVNLHKYWEELGTRLNLSTLNLNLNFRETILHADDLRKLGTLRYTFWNTSGRKNIRLPIMVILLFCI
jgi:hypothetical protein